MGIDLPGNYHDTLKTKPSIQVKARAALNKIAPFKNDQQARIYTNFLRLFYISLLIEK